MVPGSSVTGPGGPVPHDPGPAEPCPHRFGVRMAELVEHLQGLLPGVRGAVEIVARRARVTQPDQGVGLLVSVAERLPQRVGARVRLGRLLIAAQLVLRLPQAVPRVGGAEPVVDLLEHVEGLPAAADGLRVPAEQGQRPADAVVGPALPRPVARGGEQAQRRVAVAQRVVVPVLPRGDSGQVELDAALPGEVADRAVQLAGGGQVRDRLVGPAEVHADPAEAPAGRRLLRAVAEPLCCQQRDLLRGQPAQPVSPPFQEVCEGPDQQARVPVEALRRGKANKIIAYELKMRESTVKVHVRNIMKKLHATNRTEVAFMAHRLLNGEELAG